MDIYTKDDVDRLHRETMRKRIYGLGMLPNQEGFKFIGILASGNSETGNDTVECSIACDESQYHSIIGAKYEDLVGWRNMPVA